MVAVMLHRMVFHLSGKEVALLLDNSTTNGYLSNQGSKLSLFLQKPACHIVNLANKHSVTLFQHIYMLNLNVEAEYLS